jgi:hypothetical protein
MKLDTLAHATLSLRRGDDSPPILITDPWLRGSCYWRSWWLERYPSAEQIARLRGAAFCYLTHEHPDHFHTPSIRTLGQGPTYLVPELSRDMMGRYLREHGFWAQTLKAGAFRELSDDVRVLSMPTIGNDSALLIDTPHALIANLNDARPTPDQLLALRRLRHVAGKDKRCVLLASYSAAGIGNSLYRDGQRLDFAGGGRHARYVLTLARALDADAYIPFASHVSFERPDTRWANDYRVPFEEVRDLLESQRIRTFPPYVTLELQTLAFTTEHGTPARRESGIEARVQAQVSAEASQLDSDDLTRLEAKLNAAGRVLIGALFPRGIAFSFGEQRLRYLPLSGRVQADREDASMTLHLPAQAVRDVLHTGFFSDLCIPMFTRVELAAHTPPHFVYVFFTLMQLHDVGATGSVSELARFVTLGVKERGRLWRAQRAARGQLSA